MDNTKNQELAERENRIGYYGGFGDVRHIFTYPIPVFEHIIYIDDLSWLEDHQERIQLIRMATPDDNIRIVINSPGGAVAIAMAYVNAIAESAANIVTHAEGQVCSAGTVLWLSCKERTVSPLTVFMFHNYQGGTYGDGANMYSQITFEKVYFDRLIDRFYGDVLTQDEISQIRGGGQVWMDEVQILKKTTAVLLDDKNIQRMRQGKPPLKGNTERKAKGPLPLDKQEQPKKVMLRVYLGDEEHVLDAESLKKEDLSKFSDEELIVITFQLYSSAARDEELHIDDQTTRDVVEGFLLSIVGDMAKELISENPENEA